MPQFGKHYALALIHDRALHNNKFTIAVTFFDAAPGISCVDKPVAIRPLWNIIPHDTPLCSAVRKEWCLSMVL